MCKFGNITPKVMYRWATIITNIGPKMTMEPKNTLALLWSNALVIYGEKIQILDGVINKYRDVFLTMHSE